jgi:hypothetical protein
MVPLLLIVLDSLTEVGRHSFAECGMLSAVRATMVFTRSLAVTIAVVAIAFWSVKGHSAQLDRQLRLWLAIKRQLTGPNGDEYFQSAMKDSLIPAGANGVSMLKGTLTSALLNKGVSRLMLALSDSTTAEVTLVLHNGDVNVKAELGTVIEFEGVAVDFTKDPFMLSFDVQLSGVRGLKLER